MDAELSLSQRSKAVEFVMHGNSSVASPGSSLAPAWPFLAPPTAASLQNLPSQRFTLFWTPHTPSLRKHWGGGGLCEGFSQVLPPGLPAPSKYNSDSFYCPVRFSGSLHLPECFWNPSIPELLTARGLSPHIWVQLQGYFGALSNSQHPPNAQPFSAETKASIPWTRFEVLKLTPGDSDLA